MKLEWYDDFFESLATQNSNLWIEKFRNEIGSIFVDKPHGNFSKWLDIVETISCQLTNHYNFSQATIEIGKQKEIDVAKREVIFNKLKFLQPWRKGPFNIFGIHIDSEWRSDQKWDRIQPHLPPLVNKKLLDVGCGNGYFMLRMLGLGAKQVVGVDPSILFLTQFHAITRFISSTVAIHLLPIRDDQIPQELNNFDCVFSMGVLYHRRNPIEHLRKLYCATAAGGTLILETLIVENEHGKELVPADRYAGMRNVWCVPNPQLVCNWLTEAGYSEITLVNKQITTTREQRATEWMSNYSLQNFLNTKEPDKTIEGYPAPLRAIFIANKSI